MKRFVSDIAFSSAVKAVQDRLGSRKAYSNMEQRGGWENKVTPELADFISDRDPFYLGTASRDGRPYIQHRGGPAGFLKPLDDKTLGFADFSGNRQYITAGNLAENDKAYIFLMDYPNRRRIKIWGRARLVENDPALLEKLLEPGYAGKPERAIVFTIEAWDVNCPQHITPRYSDDEILALIAPLKHRIAELEAELAGRKSSP